MDFEHYKQWAAKQKCCDCGESATAKTGLWATETQCFKCFSKHGNPERRGLKSAADLAALDGVMPNVQI